MPKLKTKRSVAKRFKKTGTGKLVHKKSGTSHLLTCKTRKRKRQLKKDVLISKAKVKSINRMAPFI